MTRRPPLARLAAALALAVAAVGARAQTMLDQQQRLIDLHDLLLDLPPVQAPAALDAWQLAPGVEGISVPPIDGTTGSKRQITASDHAPLFPRLRVMLGLPAPAGGRAFAGLAYIPPVTFREITTHRGGAEAGLAWRPGAFALQLRGHAVYAFSKSPVTDPATLDTLESFTWGFDVTAGGRFDVGGALLAPYAGVGVVDLHGRFRVSSDGVVLESDRAVLAVHAGARLLFARRWEATLELDAYPGYLVHPNFRLAYLFDL